MRSLACAVLVAAAVAACGPASRSIEPTVGEPAPGTFSQPRTLVLGTRVEPGSLAAKPFQQAGLTLGSTIRLFNAGLALKDDRGQMLPYLAARLPQLNTDSWRVFPDGRMETTYELRPHLTFHDGQPLTSEDFAFSWRVYTNPDFGQATSAPQGLIEGIQTPDSRTLVIQWRRPYFYAGAIELSGLPPLPRHLLGADFEQGSPDSFVADAHWSTAYVGAGPFRLEHWERGAFMETTAFAGHALGAPKVDRLRVLFINDANTALANLLAGSIQATADDAIYFQQAIVVRREMESNGTGRVLTLPGQWRLTWIQLHPERLEPGARSLTDVRVRKALAFGLDRQAINDGIFEGEAILSDTMIPPIVDHYSEVDRVLTKYPFDPQRAQRLMEEAGYPRGRDSFFASPTEGRFSAELMNIQGAQNTSERTIMASGWRSVGFDLREAELPLALATDGETRATFKGLFAGATGAGEATFAGFGVTPRPENRWIGQNRGSWSNPVFERLSTTYDTTLDPNQRRQQVLEMARIFSEELPALSSYFNPSILAFSADLQGTRPGEGSIVWNVHEWELRGSPRP